MSESPDDGFTPVKAIYAGRREGPGGKPFVVFYVDGEAETSSFTLPKIVRQWRSAVIGGEAELLRKDATFRLNEKFLRRSNDERVESWQAADRAFDVADRARKRITTERAKGHESLLAVLAPFRDEYRRTDHVGKLALEVVLLHALRTGG